MIENRFGCAESIELGTTSALRLMLDIDMRKPKTNATENNILTEVYTTLLFSPFFILKAENESSPGLHEHHTSVRGAPNFTISRHNVLQQPLGDLDNMSLANFLRHLVSKQRRVQRRSAAAVSAIRSRAASHELLRD
jgi:hypothetical protein